MSAQTISTNRSGHVSHGPRSQTGSSMFAQVRQLPRKLKRSVGAIYNCSLYYALKCHFCLNTVALQRTAIKACITETESRNQKVLLHEQHGLYNKQPPVHLSHQLPTKLIRDGHCWHHYIYHEAHKLNTFENQEKCSKALNSFQNLGQRDDNWQRKNAGSIHGCINQTIDNLHCRVARYPGMLLILSLFLPIMQELKFVSWPFSGFLTL